MRPSRNSFYLALASMIAMRTTCVRGGKGCVIVDSFNRVLSMGYNGVPRGFEHCNEGKPCPGANEEQGKGLDKCWATHAEANALLNCSDLSKAHIIYCTHFPCIECAKLIANTNIKTIIYSQDYPSGIIATTILEKAKISWIKI